MLILSSIQGILKPHFWFSGCAIIRISSTWPCCVNLASPALWKAPQILKNQQIPTWCQEGWRQDYAGRTTWEVFGHEAQCVHLSIKIKKKLRCTQVIACGLCFVFVLQLVYEDIVAQVLFWQSVFFSIRGNHFFAFLTFDLQKKKDAWKW